MQRSQHLIFALLWWWWQLDTEDILEFYDLKAKRRQWQTTIIPWLTPCMTNHVKFQNILAICEFRVYCQPSSVLAEKIRARSDSCRSIPQSGDPEERIPGLREDPGLAAPEEGHRHKMGLSGKQLQSRIPQLQSTGAKVSWHSECIPFPVCAQNNSGLFGAEVGQTFADRKVWAPFGLLGSGSAAGFVHSSGCHWALIPSSDSNNPQSLSCSN